MQMLTRLTAAAIISTGLTVSGVEAAECKIEGPMLLQAYSAALNNDFRFECRKGTKTVGNSFQFLPTPTGLICQHHKEILPKKYEYHMIAFKSRTGGGLKNDWRIHDYTVRGGGGKRGFTSKSVHFVKRASANMPFKLTLKTIWLEKANASCTDLQRVIREAFGR